MHARPGDQPLSADDTTARVPALDVAKGIAIVFVLFIHSELLVPGAIHTHVVDRAVPMFFVLFGITSTMWWQAGRERGAIDWYRSRFSRLLPAYWLAVAAWWCGQRVFAAEPLGLVPLGWSLVAYAPWIQTSWFVTAILQVAVLYPLLRWATKKLGVPACLGIAFAAMAVSQVYALRLNAWVRGLLPYQESAIGFYPFWIFALPQLWLVMAGVAIAGVSRALSLRPMVAALATVIAAAMAGAVVDPTSATLRIAMSVGDVGRTVLLLGIAGVVVRLTPPKQVFGWAGRHSWEIYLGQMVFHSLGYTAWARHGGPDEHRLAYTLFLAAGGVGFAIVIDRLRGLSRAGVVAAARTKPTRH